MLTELKSKKPQFCSQRGVTLIEVMVALALTSIITLVIMKTYVIQHETYMSQEDVTNMQQSARSSLDELTRQIRMAGHDLPQGVAPLAAYNTNPDTIVVTYHGNDCESYLASDMAGPGSVLQLATPVSCFTAGSWGYIEIPDSAVGEWFKISQVNAGAQTIVHSDGGNLSRAYPKDARVVPLNQIKFYLRVPSSTLMMEQRGMPPSVYSEDITDLQFRYQLASGLIIDQPVLMSNVRTVLIEVTTSSTRENPDGDPQGEPNHRTYSSSANLRNNI